MPRLADAAIAGLRGGKFPQAAIMLQGRAHPLRLLPPALPRAPLVHDSGGGVSVNDTLAQGMCAWHAPPTCVNGTLAVPLLLLIDTPL